MKKMNYLAVLLASALSTAFVSVIPSSLAAQERSITCYQYRRVPDEKREEFIKRETMYWSKVAEKAVKEKTMTF